MDPPKDSTLTNEGLDVAGLRGEGESLGHLRVYPSITISVVGVSDFAPYVLSDWERINYYHGISPDPPELLYRSDLLENPFPIPKGEHPYIPAKTISGVFNTPLNAVWDTVRPQIYNILKARKIRYSSMSTVRFTTEDEDWIRTCGPIVIWISTRPSTTTAKDAHDASLDILALLKANGVEGAVVEWIEGVVERL